jgi:hypothetical protein
MCNSVASAAAPIALPLQQQLIQAFPRNDAAAALAPQGRGPSAPTPPSNPNLGRTVNLSA